MYKALFSAAWVASVIYFFLTKDSIPLHLVNAWGSGMIIGDATVEWLSKRSKAQA